MKNFQQYVPEDLKDDKPGGYQTWQDVSDVVGRVRSKWEKRKEGNKFKQATTYFRKICTTINDHSNILKLLPTESEYVALLSGSLVVVIKVSRDIPCGFNKA